MYLRGEALRSLSSARGVPVRTPGFHHGAYTLLVTLGSPYPWNENTELLSGNASPNVASIGVYAPW